MYQHLKRIINTNAMNTYYWKGLLLLFLLQGCGVGQGVVTSVPEATPDPLFTPYTYSATVIDVYDGDTFTLEFDLGSGIWAYF